MFIAGVARLFCSRAKLENYFSLQAALLKIVSYDKVTASAKKKKIGLVMLLMTVFDQISGSRRSILLGRKRSKGRKNKLVGRMWPAGRTLAMSGL